MLLSMTVQPQMQIIIRLYFKLYFNLKSKLCAKMETTLCFYDDRLGMNLYIHFVFKCLYRRFCFPLSNN